MLNFESDYITGAHPKILERMVETNLQAESGYGRDSFTASAAQKVLAACRCPKGEVVFIAGGTQTNALVIDTMLKPWEGVVAAETGHVASHEAGAIEFTGHKVITLPQHLGKVDPSELRQYIVDFYADGNHEHMVFPGMVYISHPTEYGTLYTKAELQALSEVCKGFCIPLFMDGARLGYGLTSSSTDVTLPDIAKYCDVFYIGGTKVGAFIGEAVVFTNGNKPEHFENLQKKHGALLAKGRLIGIQFETLFTDDLYLTIARHANALAEDLKAFLLAKGYRLLLDSPTNQQFVILENKQMEALKEKVRFGFWEKVDEDHTAVRFATCWSTTEEDIAELKSLL